MVCVVSVTMGVAGGIATTSMTRRAPASPDSGRAHVGFATTPLDTTPLDTTPPSVGLATTPPITASSSGF